MAKLRDLPDLSDLAVAGGEIAVRVTPRAARARLVAEAGTLRAYVTVPPEDGKANAAVRDLLAAYLGIARSRVVLVAGAKAREKRFRIDG